MIVNWYKKAQNMLNKVSFDFDETIFKTEWDKEENDFKRDENGKIIGTLNSEAETLIRDYASKGWEIFIISSRMSDKKQEIIDFVKEHNLPITNIYCTNGHYKLSTLKRLQIFTHFDDDYMEIEKINKGTNQHGIRALQI
jgi:hypothetical protein